MRTVNFRLVMMDRIIITLAILKVSVWYIYIFYDFSLFFAWHITNTLCTMELLYMELTMRQCSQMSKYFIHVFVKSHSIIFLPTNFIFLLFAHFVTFNNCSLSELWWSISSWNSFPYWANNTPDLMVLATELLE